MPSINCDGFQIIYEYSTAHTFIEARSTNFLVEHQNDCSAPTTKSEMDQRNYMMQSRYPDPEASQLQNTAWNGQHINGEGGPFGIGEQTWNSSYAPIVDGYYGGQAFDTGMTGMDGDEEGNIHWGRPLPGEDGNVDSLLEGYYSQHILRTFAKNFQLRFRS